MNALSDQPRIGDDLKMLFEALWPKSLGPAIERLRKATAPVTPPKRSIDDLLSEVLNTVRDLDRRSSTLAEQQHHVIQAVGALLDNTRWADRPMSALALSDEDINARSSMAERWAVVSRADIDRRKTVAAAKKVADTAASIAKRDAANDP